MRITQEADYALRICAVLAQTSSPVGAPALSADLNLPPRFTSKILRKLSLAGIVVSTRGVSGGFSLAVDPELLTLKKVIESIDGTVEIRHCLNNDHDCAYQHNKNECRFHNVFEKLNTIITTRLDMLTIADMTDPAIPIAELTNRLNKF